ncbi:hypothetical protein [Dokdonella sp.]|uniref:hypothetical protein n=1 Tax=Dokdonella sp. TaxID=2291710 RepID=UPI00352728F0
MAFARSTWITGLAIALFLAGALQVLLGSMEISHTRSGSTHVRLSFLRAILSECRVENLLPNEIRECVRLDAVGKNLPVGAEDYFLTDYYGEPFILERTDSCNDEFTGIYSKGPNRVDECGGGDDIH